MLWILGSCQCIDFSRAAEACAESFRSAEGMRSEAECKKRTVLLWQRPSVPDFRTTEVDALTRTVLFYLSKP